MLLAGSPALGTLLPPASMERALAALPLDREALRELYDAHRGDPAADFFEAAWDRDVLEAAVQLWFDARGRGGAVHTSEALEIPDGGVAIVHGHLRVRGSVFVRGMLFVSGDVAVGGELGDDDVGRMTIIGGDARCGVSNTQGGLRVGGDLVASALVYGNYHEDRIVVVGALHSPVTWLQLGKRLTAGRLDTVLLDDEVSVARARELQRLLHPSLLRPFDLSDGDDRDIDLAELVEVDLLYARALDGAPLLR
ncbi:MAG: hypothetical protein ABMB14_18550 [Myxococcota bacterium]